MKKYILTVALTALMTMPSLAKDEEVLVVKLTDGTESTFTLTDVDNVSFNTRRVPRDFVLTTKSGNEFIHPSIDVMFREASTETGGAVRFGFGTYSGATTPAELPQGTYGVLLSLSPAKAVDGATVDFAEERSSYSLTLVTYDGNGNMAEQNDKVESGNLTFAQNRKTGVANVVFTATFRDGTTIDVDFAGRFTPTTQLDDMLPAISYGNELYYYNGDGDLISHLDFASVKITNRTFNFQQVTRFTFTYANNASLADYSTGFVQIVDSALPAKGESVSYNLADGPGVMIDFGLMQLAAIPLDSNAMFRLLPDNGVITITCDEQEHYHIFVDVVNSYNSVGSNMELTKGGNNDHLIINYNGDL